MTRKRLLIVEDDPVAWRALARQLPDCDLTWARSLAEAKDQLTPRRWASNPADVVCMDLLLGDGDASSLIPLFGRLLPRPGIVIISGHLSPARLVEFYRQRVLAIPKGCDAQTLREAIAAALERPAYLAILRRACKHHGLTPVESEVVCAAVEGLSSVEAAERVGCSVRTLDTHWQRIFNKTRYRSKQEVIAFVLRMV